MLICYLLLGVFGVFGVFTEGTRSSDDFNALCSTIDGFLFKKKCFRFFDELSSSDKTEARYNCRYHFHPSAEIGIIISDEEQVAILDHASENNITGEYWLEFEKRYNDDKLIGFDSRKYEYSNIVQDTSIPKEKKFVTMSSDDGFKWRFKSTEGESLTFCMVDFSLKELVFPSIDHYIPIEPSYYYTQTCRSEAQCEESKPDNILVDHARHVFQIGFPKCGTTSFHVFFENNNITSCHWDGGSLPVTIYKNYLERKLLLDGTCGMLGGTEFVCNMDLTPKLNSLRFYKLLDGQYPNSRFILNIRSKENWLKSKKNAFEGGKIQILANYHNITVEEALDLLSVLWEDHLRNVTQHFEGREDKLLIFDIEKDTPDKLVDFFRDWYPNLDAKFWGQMNKTIKKGKG